ncbi:MAG TPA: patatin-like phospholipase family protein, partial [Thermoanaerobaculia bacterium]|nr:patatin-like phospholipase family protein [Thermoanaerobaculia bacterium]
NGAYEAGVLQALLHGASPVTGYRPIDPGIYTGTSVGAYNAAIMCSRPGVPAAAVADELASLWLDRIANSLRQCGNGVYRVRGVPFQFLDPGCLARPVRSLLDFGADLVELSSFGLMKGAQFALSDGTLQSRLLDLFDLDAFVSESPLKDLIDQTVDLDGLRRSSQRLTVAASNWKLGTLQLYHKLQIANQVGTTAILASAALPGIFAPVLIDGVPYVDGGLLLNTPLSPAINAGATTIHVVFLDPQVRNISLPLVPSSVDTFYRMFAIIWAANVRNDILTAGAINAARELIAGNADLAETAAARSFMRLAQRLYQQAVVGREYRQVGVHIYRPATDLGGGAGLLDFQRDRLAGLVALGYDDAVHHDCAAAGCLGTAASPDRPAPARTTWQTPAPPALPQATPAAPASQAAPSDAGWAGAR